MSSPLNSPQLFIRKVRRRLNRQLTKIQAKAPASSLKFSSPTELRNHALTTQNSGVRFSYSVNFPEYLRLQMQTKLSLSNLTSCEIKIAKTNVTVHLTCSEKTTEAAVAWAVAGMIQPSLRPHSAMSRDLNVRGIKSEHAALAMGHRIHFNDFDGSDASTMEAEHALSLRDAKITKPSFDLATFNPIGLKIRETATNPAICEIHIADSVSLNGQIQITDEFLIEKLHTYTGARLTFSTSANPLTVASLVAGVAATGIVLHAPDIIPGINDELQALITTELPAKFDTVADQQIAWMVRSEIQRRLAILHHAGAWQLQESWPLASILLVTNRGEMLKDAVASALAQTYPSKEILVGVHGIDQETATSILKDQLSLESCNIKIFAFDESLPLGQVYGMLTSSASGEYLAKFDDDDIYGPHHLWDAIIALHYSGAGLFGRTPSITWLSETKELLLRPFGNEEAFNKYIIGPTMVMKKSALLEAGGWRPTPWAVDKALIDRFIAAGLGIYRAGQLGWIYVRHNKGHTWVRDEAHFRSQAQHVWTNADAIRTQEIVLQADTKSGR